MNIGFDAKRAFHNTTGLGHYSRSLIHSLSVDFPENEYYLFNPKPSKNFKMEGNNLHEILPTTFLNKLIPSAWRSNWVKNDLRKFKIDLYHGLSHEIPFNIQQTKIKSVVTIHDLIFERYPSQYSKIDVQIYRKKFLYACRNANHIIASSEQTKNDIVEFYKIEKEKITTCYQSCNPRFEKTCSETEKNTIKKKYDLPDQFFLSVGSIIERKNLLNVCKAIQLLNTEIPLVVIGDGKEYKQEVKNYIQKNNLQKKIVFLAENIESNSLGYGTAADFPAIYQLAIALIYPSVFEGFGIPILEALWSKLPVITSNISSLPEVGGDAAIYVNPKNELDIAAGLKKIVEDTTFVNQLKEKSWMQAQKFSSKNAAAAVMNVYKTVC